MEKMRKYRLITGLFLCVLLLAGCGMVEASKKDHGSQNLWSNLYDPQQSVF